MPSSSSSSELHDNSSKESVASLLRKERQKLSKFHRWTCQDDLMLRRAAEDGMTSAEIVESVKFSVRFSQADVEERWEALLYDTGVAEQTSKAMDVLEHTTKRVPWTEEEDRIIVDELTQKGFVSFHQVLDKHRDRFHPSRTVRSLEAHFYRMKRNGVFNNIPHFHTSKSAADPQHITHETQEMTAPGIGEAENAALAEANAGQGAANLTAEEKRAAKQAMQLEAEEESAAVHEGIAHFRGEKTVLIVREREHIIGRRTKETRDDQQLLDVSEEGTASKVSRKQAILRLEDNDGDYIEHNNNNNNTASTAGKSSDKDGKKGETTSSKKSTEKKKKRRKKSPIFTLENVGKRELVVNGEPLRRHQRVVLPNHAFLEMPGYIAFTFHIHRGNLCQPQSTSKTES